MPNDSSHADSAAPREFHTTQWSLVLRAGRQEVARAALQELCQRYWYPLYAYVRRKGHSPEEASDLTQAFFLSFIEKHDVAAANPERGRFRSFLLSAMNHFMANHWRAKRTQKRGGGKIASLSVNFEEGESRYCHEPAHTDTAERIFERRWALTMLEEALAALRDEMTTVGKATHFETLKPFLDDSSSITYEQAAASLNMSAVAVRVAVHRLREKYRRHLRDRVAQTVDSPEEIDRELADLLRAITGK
jgi:RNA polymerase sigma factor (sigma-70 family)